MTCYGFVYIWYVTIRKMFYVGSHKGIPTDGYICSSKVMKYAYKKRPHTFSRKILKMCYENNLHEVEQHYLNMIKGDELFYKRKKSIIT